MVDLVGVAGSNKFMDKPQADLPKNLV